jgi:hypothetical protein
MKISDTFLELERQYPERKANSPGLAQVVNAVKEQATALGISVSTQKISVFNFHVSLLVYIIGSLAIIDLGFFIPWAGFCAGLVFYLLLLTEIIRPVFAKLKTVPEKNLILTVEARSKETQRVLVVTDLSTDSFIQPPPRFSTRIYLYVIFLLGLGTVISLGLNCLFAHKFMLLVAVMMVLGIIYLKIFGHTSELHGKTLPETASLSNGAVMVELAQILSKGGPFRTSVKFLFTTAGSLNSGVLKAPDLLDPRLSFNYVIELINRPDKRINVVTADGLLFPTIKNHPLLVELFMEVARAKNIPVQEIKLSQVTAANTMKSKKINTITLTNPLHNYSGSDPNKDLRELIIGLIRKIDHPE